MIATSKMAKTLSLFLVFCVTQVYVQANLTTHKPAVLPDRDLIAGRLSTTGNKLVFVDGDSVASGTAILSGAQIQTPAEVGATANLGRLGKVDLAPETNLRVAFDRESVDVTIAQGYAVLTTSAGIRGSLTTPEKTERTDPATVSSVEASAGQDKDKDKDRGAAGAGGQGAGGAGGTQGNVSGGLFGIGKPATIAFVVAASAFAVGAFAAQRCNPNRQVPRGPNPSPGEPRGRNNPCR